MKVLLPRAQLKAPDPEHPVCVSKAFFFVVIASWLSYVGACLENKYGAINTVKTKHTYISSS